MRRWMLHKVVICAMILVVGCSSVNRVVVPSSDYSRLEREEKVFVTTKNQGKLEMTNIQVDDTGIKGTVVTRDSSDNIIDTYEAEIKIEDIRYVEVEEREGNRRTVFIVVLVAAGVVALAVGFVAIYVASGLPNF